MYWFAFWILAEAAADAFNECYVVSTKCPVLLFIVFERTPSFHVNVASNVTRRHIWRHVTKWAVNKTLKYHCRKSIRVILLIFGTLKIYGRPHILPELQAHCNFQRYRPFIFLGHTPYFQDYCAYSFQNLISSRFL